jgi:hypothetical protein
VRRKETPSRILACLVILASLILALPLLFIGAHLLFGSDYRVELPNGYRLVRLSGKEIIVTQPGPDNLLISPTVDGYIVKGTLVVGHVRQSSGVIARSVQRSRPGYFLVDTEKGEAFQGLSEADWLRMLKKYGITSKPQLRKPSRFDRYRR